MSPFLRTAGKGKKMPIMAGSLLLFLTIALLTIDTGVREMENTRHQHHRSCEGEEDGLCYIPQDVRQVWRERTFLIVLGIPSLDDSEHRMRRDLQRGSWMRFPGVATLSTSFTGEMLVLFFLGHHFTHPYTYSRESMKETAEFCDVLTPFGVTDHQPATKKRIGDGGYWGFEAEVGASRKSYVWYRTALRLFPTASYIAKGDDDMFLRVPQLLADLYTLPRSGVYWGRMLQWLAKKGDPKTLFYFAGGMCIIMSSDIAAHITSYAPLQQLLGTQFASLSPDELVRFGSLNTNHEDVMLGRVLYETRYSRVKFVYEKKCRFHDIHVGGNMAPITHHSVLVHHLKPHDYAKLALLFMKGGQEPKPIRFERRPGRVGIVGEALYSYHC